jgi:DNA repair exonuclease SbcCD nuclease subunit
VRLVVVSDLHADWSTLGVPRHDEVRAVAEASARAAASERADAWLFLGDLCDPDNGGATMRAVAMMIDVVSGLLDGGVRCVLVAGNHDACLDGSGATTLSPIAAMRHELLHVFERPGTLRLDARATLIALPFAAGPNAYEPARFAREAWPEDGEAIVAGHLTIPGMHPGSETTDMPRGREVTFPFEETRRAALRMNGHYHEHTAFDPSDGGPSIVVPGSAARLTFGEERHRPGFLLIDC